MCKPEGNVVNVVFGFVFNNFISLLSFFLLFRIVPCLLNCGPLMMI